MTPGGILTLPRGFIHVYMFIVKQVHWYMLYISGERLQDHWSSCTILVGYKNNVLHKSQ